jgi:hypothetical protein
MCKPTCKDQTAAHAPFTLAPVVGVVACCQLASQDDWRGAHRLADHPAALGTVRDQLEHAVALIVCSTSSNRTHKKPRAEFCCALGLVLPTALTVWCSLQHPSLKPGHHQLPPSQPGSAISNIQSSTYCTQHPTDKTPCRQYRQKAACSLTRAVQEAAHGEVEWRPLLPCI